MTAAVEAAPWARLYASRTDTDTDTGPAVRATLPVARPTAVADTNASHVGPSPSHTSRYPSRSATAATRNGSSTGLSSSRAAATTLMSMAAPLPGRHRPHRGPCMHRGHPRG